jgi:hypothetical protein
MINVLMLFSYQVVDVVLPACVTKTNQGNERPLHPKPLSSIIVTSTRLTVESVYKAVRRSQCIDFF